tara:strand:+ start:5241 stop:5594 length:354 start_codon:yes stop_codon:yes gene_type:complete
MEEYVIDLYDELPGQLDWCQSDEEVETACSNLVGADITIKYRLHPAEPDVGIDSPQPELVLVTYDLDWEFTTHDALVFATHLKQNVLHDTCHETAEDLADMFTNRIENAMHDLPLMA